MRNVEPSLESKNYVLLFLGKENDDSKKFCKYCGKRTAYKEKEKLSPHLIRKKIRNSTMRKSMRPSKSRRKMNISYLTVRTESFIKVILKVLPRMNAG